MRVWSKFGRGAAIASVMLALGVPPIFGQNHRAPSYSPSRPSRSEPRVQNRGPQPQFRQPRPEVRQAPPREFRPYQPPTQGHHSGQWLNQHRGLSPDQQRRALENDPQFRRLPADRQQRLEQRLQRFNSLPADRQQQILRRMETWEHLTPQQKQEFRGLGGQFNSLPPERRQAVRNAIESLRAMPPDAREREIQSGRFSQFSPQERQILSGASRLPLAPAEPRDGSAPPETGPQRYIPRPPQ